MNDTSSPEVFRIGIPNPMFEGEINMYVIAGDPLTLVDTGLGTPEALAAVEAGLAAHGFTVDAVRQIVLTHKHADHIGLARDIYDQSGAKVWIHEDDWDNVANLDRRHEEYLPLLRAKLASFHTPEAEIDALTSMMGKGKRFARQCPAERLVDGQRLTVSGRELEVLHTPGHTQGSICLKFGDHLFSGDHVLPTISPNIGAGELRRRGMMTRYLHSLDRVAALDNGHLTVLPGHGNAFTNLQQRVGQLKGHHAERETLILDILRAAPEPQTVYQVARAMWARLPGFHLALGTSEANSHLEKSCDDGVVRESEGRFSLA